MTLPVTAATVASSEIIQQIPASHWFISGSQASHQFSVGDGQDGVSIIGHGGAAQVLAVLAVTVRWNGRRFPLGLARLALSFSRGSGAELTDWVREPLLQGAHRALGARGAGSRAARCLRGQ